MKGQEKAVEGSAGSRKGSARSRKRSALYRERLDVSQVPVQDVELHRRHGSTARNGTVLARKGSENTSIRQCLRLTFIADMPSIIRLMFSTCPTSPHERFWAFLLRRHQCAAIAEGSTRLENSALEGM